MNRKNFVISILAAMCCIATCAVVPSTGNAQTDPRITKSMGSLKAMTAKLGAPKLEGKEAVGGKEAPALYFGKTNVNNNFDVVDAVGKEDGKGMTATLFAKSGDEYIRVSTSVPKPDGSGRAVGTVLAGPALESIKAGKAHYGEVPILGTPYVTGYEPIKDSSGVRNTASAPRRQTTRKQRPDWRLYADPAVQHDRHAAADGINDGGQRPQGRRSSSYLRQKCILRAAERYPRRADNLTP